MTATAGLSRFERRSESKVSFGQTLEDAFPDVDPGVTPCGSRILVQLRTSKKTTASGLILVEETRESEKWNQQTAKVVALGSLAFHNRTTLQEWPEGAWCKAGDYIRVPMHGGDKWERPTGNKSIDPVTGKEVEETALFVIFNDADIIGKITTDPRDIKAFI